MLTAFGHIGYCNKCETWLGLTFNRARQSNSILPTDLHWQQCVVASVGELLTCAARLEAPVPRRVLTQGLNTLYSSTKERGKHQPAEDIPLSRQGMDDIISGRRRPQLETLLQLCTYSGTTPAQLLRVANSELTGPDQRASQEVQLRKRKSSRRWNLEEIRKLLAEVVERQDEPPPSMAEVARRIGYDHGNLAVRFPELCRTISSRYLDYSRARRGEWLARCLEEIEQVMRMLHRQGTYPTHQRLMDNLTDPHCLRLPEARAKRRALLAELF